MACSTCFVIPRRTTCLEVAPSTVDWSLPYPSSRKSRLAYGLSDVGNSSVMVPSSQLNQDFFMIFNVFQHNIFNDCLGISHYVPPSHRLPSPSCLLHSLVTSPCKEDALKKKERKTDTFWVVPIPTEAW